MALSSQIEQLCNELERSPFTADLECRVCAAVGSVLDDPSNWEAGEKLLTLWMLRAPEFARSEPLIHLARLLILQEKYADAIDLACQFVRNSDNNAANSTAPADYWNWTAQAAYSRSIALGCLADYGGFWQKKQQLVDSITDLLSVIGSEAKGLQPIILRRLMQSCYRLFYEVDNPEEVRGALEAIGRLAK